MPKLIDPDGNTVSATADGAKVLLKHGYTDPDAPAKKTKKDPEPEIEVISDTTLTKHADRARGSR